MEHVVLILSIYATSITIKFQKIATQSAECISFGMNKRVIKVPLHSPSPSLRKPLATFLISLVHRLVIPQLFSFPYN